MPDARSRRARAALVAGLVLLALAGAPLLAFETAEYEKAAKTILCDCGCHPQSVHDCACSRAAEMREDISRLIDQGMTGEQVIASYVAEHGEQILIAPEATGFNLVAWLGPLAALVVACGGMFWMARRWTRRRDADAVQPAARLAEDDPYVGRLERELKELR